MKILLFSSDSSLIKCLSSSNLDEEIQIKIISSVKDEMDGISKIYTQNPNIVVIDDDMIKPNSIRYIQTIKKSKKNIKIIFLTSDNSVEFGRNIISNGVSTYVIKPLEEKELYEHIKSASKIINSFN